MDVWTILTCVIAGLGLMWAIFRDRTSDTNDLLDRMSDVEKTLALHDSAIDRLQEEQDEMKTSLKNLEVQIHQLDLKIERILTILESKKGA